MAFLMDIIHGKLVLEFEAEIERIIGVVPLSSIDFMLSLQLIVSGISLWIPILSGRFKITIFSVKSNGKQIWGPGKIMYKSIVDWK